jgi:GT2 family glycosyltransferase
LAAARNTAFKTARAEWCFVLDADNELLPEAVERCLAIAHASAERTAVVHPLVGIHYSNPDPMPRSFISTVSWQRQQFLNGNVVDAMALVRRSAWHNVGGYTHIPGGWEDFDFWCLLIEAGFHGVLCPQRLAVYRCHEASMAATGTRLQERRLSRLLQARHPWLELPKRTVGENEYL